MHLSYHATVVLTAQLLYHRVAEDVFVSCKLPYICKTNLSNRKSKQLLDFNIGMARRFCLSLTFPPMSISVLMTQAARLTAKQIGLACAG